MSPNKPTSSVSISAPISSTLRHTGGNNAEVLNNLVPVNEIPTPRKVENNKPMMGKGLPSGSQLPLCWNEEMDRTICYVEAAGEMDMMGGIRLLKRKFPELEGHVITVDAVERRVAILELMENDYFKTGSEAAVAIAEGRGYVLPEYDPENYVVKAEPAKSDEEIFGKGDFAKGSRMYGDDNDPDMKNVTGGVSRMSTAPVVATGTQTSGQGQANTAPRVQIAGRYVDPRGLQDVTNARDHPSPALASPGSADTGPPTPKKDKKYLNEGSSSMNDMTAGSTSNGLRYRTGNENGPSPTQTLRDRRMARVDARAASGASASGASASGASASGPSASGPSASGVSASDPSATGTSASGPSAAGTSASGPSAAGTSATGPP